MRIWHGPYRTNLSTVYKNNKRERTGHDLSFRNLFHMIFGTFSLFWLPVFGIMDFFAQIWKRMKLTTITFVTRPWHFVPFLAGRFLPRTISLIAKKNPFNVRESVCVIKVWKKSHTELNAQNNSRLYEI